ncbi:hypothetical protein AYO39_00435 [Actinobacteria bacterium SCGC AG-212-D09]|nr:hypothetical protein AYO39_00435 [Actinobacteria bacterium SCGC AG-212-D09]
MQDFPAVDRSEVILELEALGVGNHVNGLLADEAREVGVALGEFGAFVGWLDVEWPGPATPVWTLRSVVHLSALQSDLLRQEIAGARQKREMALRSCDICRSRLTTGRLHRYGAGYVCHGCAEVKLGMVH